MSGVSSFNSSKGRKSDGKSMNPDRTADKKGGDGGSSSSPPGQTSVHDDPKVETDEQLLSKYRTGDKPAFGKLVGRYERELFHFLVRFLGDRAAAEDVFQEAFLQVHQSADQFDPSRR